MDTKFFSHTVRLLVECEEILLEENISFPIKERDLILDIKLGKVSLPEVNRIVDQKWEQVTNAFKLSKLPMSPNKNKIHEFSMDVINSVFK